MFGEVNIDDITEEKHEHRIVGVKKILPFAALLIPLLLMSFGVLYSVKNDITDFIKKPVWALMIGVFFALPLTGKLNFTKRLNDFFKNSSTKSAPVILITGVGGAFGQVIKDSEIVGSLFSNSADFATAGIVLPFLLSFLFTSVTGSITVSLITTSSIVAPLVARGVLQPEITAAAIGAGSLGIIHVK